MSTGRRLTIAYRKLGRRDAARYAAHLRRLAGPDRVARFMGEVGPGGAGRHLARIDWDRAVLLGCFVDGVMRGAAELHLAASDPRAAEAAFSVEGPFQGRGLGTELVRRLLVLARNRAVRRVLLLCSAGNARIRRIVTRLGADLTAAGGEAVARLDLLPATPATFLSELLDDAEDLRSTLASVGARLGGRLRELPPARWLDALSTPWEFSRRCWAAEAI